MRLLRFVFATVLFFMIDSFSLTAQSYLPADSVAIYKLLDEADAEDLAGNLDKAAMLVKKALSLSNEKKMKRGEGFALLKLADLKLKKDGTENILPLFEAPLRLGLQLKDSFLIGLTYQQKGQVFLNQANYKEAEINYNKALSYYTEQNNADYRAMILNENGFISERMGAYEKAASYYIGALQIFEKQKNIKEAANTTGNLAVTNYRMGDKETAIRLFKKSAQMREQIGDAKGLAATYGNLVTVYTSVSLDSAFSYQQLVLQLVSKTGVKTNIAQASTNAAALLTRQKKYTEALSFQTKAMELYKEVGDKLKLGNQYVALAGIYNMLNDSVKAEMYFMQANELAKELNSKPLFQTIYTQQADFYFKRNQFQKAYQYNQTATTYKDSLVNEKTASTIAELQKKYETEKKDNEIAKLETERKINLLEIEKQKALLAGNKAEAQRKEIQIQLLKQEQALQDAEIVRQKEELEKQTLLNKNNEQQLLLSVQELQIAENEKKIRMRQLDKERLLRNGIIGATVLLLLVAGLLFNRYQLRKKIEEQQALLEVRNKISKDLHDDIGSTLTSIHILSNVSEEAIEQNPQHAKAMIHDIAMQSKTIQQNMSDIVWAIRPDNDKVENLSARMREYIGQTLEPKQLKTTFTVNEAILGTTLPMEFRKELLLIYKEAVNNVVKHSGATDVTIELEGTTHQLEMRIADNGRWKEKPKSSGTGTYSMKQRAEVLGGSLTIKGSDAGTEVKLTVPLP
jgi:two-component system, NarL family, sensor histidine kinase UhpB